MLTRVVNLALALLGSLLFLFTLIEGQSPAGVMDVIVALVMFCWLAGAIALFLKQRLAWPANLLGLGVMFSGCFTAFAVSLKLAPTSRDPTEGVGMMMIVGLFGMLVSVSVVIGLVKLRRKEVFHETQPTRPT